MGNKIVISKATVDRLPIYFRTLNNMKENGIEVVSSEELGRRIGFSPEQIRKDLATFGEFGKKGVGYYVSYLIEKILEILGLDQPWNICIVGYGHLGNALAHYQNFFKIGFHLKAIFDHDVEKIGFHDKDPVEIFHSARLNEVIKKENIRIGVIAVPASYAQKVANQLVDAGVQGIWNFAPIRLDVPEDICLISEDLSIGLSTLSYYMTNKRLGS